MAVSSPIPINIPPGVVYGRGEASSNGRWVDGDKVRFRSGRAEKIGGWQKAIATTFTGLARGIIGWTTKAGVDIVCFGTATKCYAATDTFDNITPLRDSGQLTNPFSTTISSDVVDVADTAHGLDDGATANFQNATAVGGITIDGDYLVTVVDDDNYQITHSSAATSTAGPGGGTVDYEYEINPGETESSYGLGFGAGAFGEGTFGTPRTGTDGIEFEMRYWHFARYGTQLLVLPSGGGLYQWDEPNVADRAVIVTNAPTSSRAMFMTAERYPVLLGTQELSSGLVNPMHMRWPDVDDITDWIPTSVNRANARTLQAGNRLMAGTILGTVNLVWSDTALYLMQFLPGSELIYDTRVVSTNCGLIAPGAFVITPLGAFWMSNDAFYVYSGTIERVPRQEEIQTAIFPIETGSSEAKRLNRSHANKVACGYNRKSREVIWNYPSASSTEPDRYIAVSLEDWSWHFGTLARTAMTANPRPGGDIIMAGDDNYLYQHEVGKNADGSAMEAWIESDFVSLGDGRTDIDLEGFVPIFDRHVGDVTLDITIRDRPESSSDLETESFTIATTDDLVDIYMGGRYAKMRLTTNEVDGDFRLGIPLIELGPAGEAR